MEFILSPNDNLPPEYYLSALAQEAANETLKEALSDPGGSMCLVVQFRDAQNSIVIVLLLISNFTIQYIVIAGPTNTIYWYCHTSQYNILVLSVVPIQYIVIFGFPNTIYCYCWMTQYNILLLLDDQIQYIVIVG